MRFIVNLLYAMQYESVKNYFIHLESFFILWYAYHKVVIYMDIGQRIKEARKMCNLTQKQLAEKIGVAEITIRQYESNKRSPSWGQLQILADALGVDMGYMISIETNYDLDKALEPYQISIEDKSLSEVYDRIEDSLRYINMSKKRLAEEINVPYSLLIPAFNQKSDRFIIEHIESIAAILGVSANLLLHGYPTSVETYYPPSVIGTEPIVTTKFSDGATIVDGQADTILKYDNEVEKVLILENALKDVSANPNSPYNFRNSVARELGIALTDEEWEALKAFSALPKDIRKAWLDMAKILTQRSTGDENDDPIDKGNTTNHGTQEDTQGSEDSPKLQQTGDN